MRFLTYLAASLWTCHLVTGEAPDVQTCPCDVPTTDQVHDVDALQKELQQQGREISRLKALIASQTASPSSQKAEISSQRTPQEDQTTAHRALRAGEEVPLEILVQQQAGQLADLKAQISAQTTSFNLEISALQSQLGMCNVHSKIITG